MKKSYLQPNVEVLSVQTTTLMSSPEPAPVMTLHNNAPTNYQW